MLNNVKIVGLVLGIGGCLVLCVCLFLLLLIVVRSLLICIIFTNIIVDMSQKERVCSNVRRYRRGKFHSRINFNLALSSKQ